MKLHELIRRFRALADDRVEDYLFSTSDIVDWLNDAQAQACVRGRLIREDSLQDVCRVSLSPGLSTYPLHEAAYEIINLRMLTAVGGPRDVRLRSPEWLDAEIPGWRDWDRPACFAIQHDTTIRVVGKIEAGDTLALECYRLPIDRLQESDPEGRPEIHAAHHEHLVQWALHKAFSIPDSETFDPGRASAAEGAFTAYFGIHPGSDMRRITREDREHHNMSYIA